LAQDLDAAQLERITREVGLADAIALGAEILAGLVRGRVVVNVNA
jgi:acrylyl-CoA reductase (NADPH)